MLPSSVSPLGKRESMILSSTSPRARTSASARTSSLAMAPQHFSDLERELGRLRKVKLKWGAWGVAACDFSAHLLHIGP